MPPIGSVGWIDLTVPDAPRVRDFYKDVVGWTVSEFDMGGYSDYVMQQPDDGTGVAGVCHATGANAGLPPAWLVYWIVASVDAAIEACTARGGAVVAGPRTHGEHARYAILRDPAGAVFAVFQSDAT